VFSRASAENFPGGEGANEKRPKISKKYRKTALFASSRGGGGNGKKDRKNNKKGRKIAKKGRKIARLSLYVLYLYNV